MSLLAALACAAGGGAAPIHRFVVSQTSGSLSSTDFWQNNTSAGALQGDVGGSPDTGFSVFPFGVFGDYNSSANAYGSGVLGTTNTGYGVVGESFSSTNASVYAYAGSTGTALLAKNVNSGGGAGIQGMSQTGIGIIGMAATGGTGSLGSATGEGVIATGTSGNATHPALSINSTVASTDFVGAFNPSSQETFIVQAGTQNRSGAALASGSDVQVSGDLYVYGRVYSDCAAFPATSTVSCAAGPTAIARGGGASVTDAPSEAFGRGVLVNGSGSVSFSDAASMSISRGSYFVFLTPTADNRGLYVAHRSARGFTVRESSGGRSSLAFDYRIVADAIGTAASAERATNKNEFIEPNRAIAQHNAAVDRLRALANGAPAPVMRR